MIIPFIIAGFVLLVAFVVHLAGGTKVYLAIRPSADDRNLIPWAMGAGTFQMVSVDLLLTGIFALMLGFEVIDYNYYLALFITLIYAGYMVAWLATMALLRRGSLFKILWQWMIFLAALALMACGIMMQ